MHNLLTLVDQLYFICKRKRKSISVTKKVKKNIYSGLEQNGRRRERTFLSIKTLSDNVSLSSSLPEGFPGGQNFYVASFRKDSRALRVKAPILKRGRQGNSHTESIAGCYRSCCIDVYVRQKTVLDVRGGDPGKPSHSSRHVYRMHKPPRGHFRQGHGIKI